MSLAHLRAFSKLCRFYAIPGSINSSLSWNFTHSSRQFASLSPSVAEPTNTPPTDNASQPWRLVAAVCVQRMPTLGRIKTELELRYEAMKDEVSLEKSKLSDFELEELQFERIKKARIKKAQDEDVDIKSLDDDETDVFEDLQESRELEFQDFTPAPRLTEADKTCDMKSLNRKLDRVLYLIVKKPRQEHAWQMPQGGVEGEESLIQAAKREFREECGNSMQLKFYSNSPLAAFSYKNTSPDVHVVGSKVFFLKAFHQSGVVELDGKELVDFMWVTKEEMSDYVSRDYYQAVQAILTE